MGIAEVCSRFIGDFLQTFKSSAQSSVSSDVDGSEHAWKGERMVKVDEKMVGALVTVFGMESNGRIKKESAREVVEKLGLGELMDDEEPLEEVLGELEDMSKRSELLHEAFKIFDEDGDGYIDAMELKRVLDCLGLDKGWDMNAIEKMVKVADLNFDGKVDFGEFEFMMMG
ncbi:hypothetical protein V8G54_006550 [Vigna mungo]|uniref:EF-hand domain-containing protein n=1 Tax=Vigna mungo TaxID=3915 RepID=A0AAQ3P0P4_VIGMU